MEQNKLLISSYAANTEVLTQHGWKLIKDIEPSIDKIYSLDGNTNEIKAVSVINKERNFYSGDMYCFNNNNIDICVTPYTKLFSYQRTQLNNERIYKYLGCIPAINIKSSYCMPILNFLWHGKDMEYFTLPATTQLEQYSRKLINVPEKHIPIDAWLEFFGFYLADGCYRDHINCVNGNRDYTVSIKQDIKNEAYVINLIKNIGFTCTISAGSSPSNNNYNIHSKQLWEYLQQFGRSKDKYIPDEFLNLNIKHLLALFTGYTNGDTYTSEQGSKHFSSVSKKLMENIQEIILKLFGRIVQTSICTKKHNYDDNTTTLYCINTKLNKSQNKYITYGKTNKNIINYKGNVYNLLLEEPFFMLTRRNGKISWCGSY